jgi:hypothetical protein
MKVLLPLGGEVMRGNLSRRLSYMASMLHSLS